MTSGGVPDVLYALAYRTWADGAKVGYAFSAERIAEQLRDDTTLPRVVLADPLRSHLNRLRKAPEAPIFSSDPTRQHLRPRRWARGEPTDVAEAKKVLQRLDRRLAARVDPSRTVLVTSHPVLAAVADTSRWRDVAYYAWDDYRGVPGCDDVVRWAYAEIAARQVPVVAVTQAILDLIGTTHGTVVPNGILASDLDHLPPVPDWFAELSGPVAFYAGGLQRRIDVKALAALASDLPEWTVVLVGPMQEPDQFQALADLDNVLIRDAEPRPRVLAMMSAADVCLVPHVAETAWMSPLKVYEYLACGAEVVATDVEPMRGLSSHCHLVPEGTPLAPAVLAASAAPRATAQEVRDFRSTHDWGKRYLDWRAVVLGY